MRFIVNIDSRKVLMSATQLESLTNLLTECEQACEDYVGNGKGDTGGNLQYQRSIKYVPVEDWFSTKVIPADLIDTIKLKMKLESKS